MSAVHMTPPKPVRRWKADDYAANGPFVSELARPVLDLLAPRRGERPELVIAGVHRAFRPHGRFAGEFGGHGNVAAIATAIRAVGAFHGGDPDKVAPWFFPSVTEYRRLPEQGGFTVKAIMLVPRPTTLDIGIRMARDLRPFLLRAV
jgi:hypothetical protein